VESVESQPAAETVEQIVDRKRARAVDERALDALFRDAHSANRFQPAPIPHELLERAVVLAELGPTSSNIVPMRIVFVESPQARERLVPTLSEGNVDKVRSAPVTAIVAADLQFYEYMPKLAPQRPNARDRFADPSFAERAREMALMNATLQGAYFVLAARSLGLDCGPMGGFDRAKADAEFFLDGRWKSIFLIALGYAQDSATRPRAPRLDFDEIARFE
jgi:3-hydroxypropanoate dehydrogenase